MSRVAPLYKVESFRGSIRDLLDMDADALAALRAATVSELTDTVSDAPMRSATELARRAFGLLYEAAVRDGVDDVSDELVAAFPEEPQDRINRLVVALTPDADDKERIIGVEERDAFLPILVGHRLALDLRVFDGQQGLPIATPFVSARFEFDSNVVPSGSAIVFQINLADIEKLIGALTAINERAEKVITGSAGVTIPEWAHGVSG